MGRRRLVNIPGHRIPPAGPIFWNLIIAGWPFAPAQACSWDGFGSCGLLHRPTPLMLTQRRCCWKSGALHLGSFAPSMQQGDQVTCTPRAEPLFPVSFQTLCSFRLSSQRQATEKQQEVFPDAAVIASTVASDTGPLSLAALPPPPVTLFSSPPASSPSHPHKCHHWPVAIVMSIPVIQLLVFTLISSNSSFPAPKPHCHLETAPGACVVATLRQREDELSLPRWKVMDSPLPP